jgi:hypothetical protein
MTRLHNIHQDFIRSLAHVQDLIVVGKVQGCVLYKNMGPHKVELIAQACGQGLYQNKGLHKVELTAGQILEKRVAKLTSIAQAHISINVDLQGIVQNFPRVLENIVNSHKPRTW